MSPPGKNRSAPKRAVRYVQARYRLGRKKAVAWVAETKRARELEKTMLVSSHPFRTTDGKQVTILRAGFSNPFQIREQNRIRPVVFVLVKKTRFGRGKICLFYKSTGRQSGMPGTWLPSKGLVERKTIDRGRIHLPDELVKFAGRPNLIEGQSAGFQDWVWKTSKKIRKLEENGSLRLHDDWSMSTYGTIMRRVFMFKGQLVDRDVEKTAKKK